MESIPDSGHAGLTGRCDGIAYRPASKAQVGVLVLAGSSGRIEDRRCRLLADKGALAVSIRWFGGPGQPPGICEIPLETFGEVIDAMIAEGVQRVGVLGLSKGAEAALLLSTVDPRVDAVVAVSPSAYVWANIGPCSDGRLRPQRSSWTWKGKPIPFVPYDDRWVEPTTKPVAYRPLYEQSLAAFAQKVEQASIPIETAAAQLLLIAGEDDQLWPSADFARVLERRRRSAGRQVTSVIDVDAGHRPIFPGEDPPPGSSERLYGGTAEADEDLGRHAWPEVLQLLGL